MKAVTKNGLALDVAANQFKADKEIVLAAVENDSDAFSYVDKTGNMWKDKNFVLSLVKMQGFALEYAKDFTSNREVVLAAVSNRGSAIQHANDTFKSDKDVVLAAVRNESSALLHINKTADMWKKDTDFVLSIVNLERDAFSHVNKSGNMWTEKNFVLSVVRLRGDALKFAAKDLKEDSDVVMAAVNQKGDALAFADKKAEFWKKRDIVLSLVQSTGRALEFASDSIKADKDVVLAAVRTTPTSLKFAQKDLIEDQDCVKASGLSYLCPYQGPGGLSDKQQTYSHNQQASVSVKFGVASPSTDYAANFGVMLMRNAYLREFKIHCPNAWRTSSCDPGFTNIQHPCRGTTSTCKFKETQNLVAKTPGGKKQPTHKSCWRFSFRYHLEESKKTKGFMIQVQEKEGLGDGQRIETKMAQDAGVKIFRTIATSEDVTEQHLMVLESKIKEWYLKGCKNKYMHEIFLPECQKPSSKDSHVLTTDVRV